MEWFDVKVETIESVYALNAEDALRKVEQSYSHDPYTTVIGVVDEEDE